MVELVTSSPYFFLWLLAFVITYAAAYISQNPRLWKLWKYSGPMCYIGVFAMVAIIFLKGIS